MLKYSPEERGTERRALIRAAERRARYPHALADVQDYLSRLLAESGSSLKLARRMRMPYNTLKTLMCRVGVPVAKHVPADAKYLSTLTSAEELIMLIDCGRHARARDHLNFMFDRFETQIAVARFLEIHWRTLRRWMRKVVLHRRGYTRPALTEMQRLMRTDLQKARALLVGAIRREGSKGRAAVVLGVHRRSLDRFMAQLGMLN